MFISIHGRCRLTLVTQWPHAAASVAASKPSNVGSMVPYEGERKETKSAATKPHWRGQCGRHSGQPVVECLDGAALWCVKHGPTGCVLAGLAHGMRSEQRTSPLVKAEATTRAG
jgi:hypothetical protein